VLRAETKLEIKNVNLGGRRCGSAVSQAVKSLDGVRVVCDRKNKTVSLTAPDDATAQKALDAIAAAGFYGDTGNQKLKIKDDSGVKKGKVKKLTLTGIHNCCPICSRNIQESIKKVEGVTGNTVQPGKNTFDVTGEFDAVDLVKALNAAGFHVKVKK
jgi:copper chaperone CopZ